MFVNLFPFSFRKLYDPREIITRRGFFVLDSMKIEEKNFLILLQRVKLNEEDFIIRIFFDQLELLLCAT